MMPSLRHRLRLPFEFSPPSQRGEARRYFPMGPSWHGYALPPAAEPLVVRFEARWRRARDMLVALAIACALAAIATGVEACILPAVVAAAAWPWLYARSARRCFAAFPTIPPDPAWIGFRNRLRVAAGLMSARRAAVLTAGSLLFAMVGVYLWRHTTERVAAVLCTGVFLFFALVGATVLVVKMLDQDRRFRHGG